MTFYISACSYEGNSKINVGSTGQSQTTANINAEKGKKEEIPLAQLMERQKNGEKMLVVFVQDGCSYCEQFDEMAEKYLENNNIVLNVVNLTTEEKYNSKEDIKKALKASVGGIEKTPALFYIESENSVHILDYTTGEYTEDTFSQFVEKYIKSQE